MGTFYLLHNQIRLNINETSRRRIFARTKARVILLKGNYFINIIGEMSETKVRFSLQDHTMTVNTPIGMHFVVPEVGFVLEQTWRSEAFDEPFPWQPSRLNCSLPPICPFLLAGVERRAETNPLFLRIWLQNMILGPLSYRVFRETGPKSRDTTRFPRFSPTRGQFNELHL